MTTTVNELLKAFPRDLKRLDRGKKDKPIASITADSRKAQRHGLFAAIRGTHANGEDYIDDVKATKVSAILTRNDTKPISGVAHLATENERQMLAKIAAIMHPSEALKVVGITGTNGKTSTAEFYRQLMEAEGEKSASIGTMGLNSSTVKGVQIRALNTSPGPVLLHQTLEKLQHKGVQSVALETSSHGLDQHRVDGVRFTAAAFTNLSRDHLDYHKDEEDYFRAKLRLFAQLLPRGATAVLNKEDKRFPQLKKMCDLRKHKILTYGVDDGADLLIRRIEPHGNGMQLRLRLHGQRYEAELPLIGRFQAMNVLAALGLAEASGHDMLDLTHHIRSLQPVCGRMERIIPGVYIDYAHTPDALEKALTAMREHCSGRLILVFGCGGDRDAGKRQPMGEIAAKLADQIYITDDNPRTENAEDIRKAILKGCPDAKEVADRKEAIAAAISDRREGDMVLIAGKGHETYQIIGEDTLPFDDAEIIRNAA